MCAHLFLLALPIHCILLVDFLGYLNNIAILDLLLMVQFIDRLHTVLHQKSIFQTVGFKLIQRAIKRQAIIYTFLGEVLLEMDDLLLLTITVLLNQIEQLHYHL